MTFIFWEDNELGLKWIFSNFIAEFSILVSYLNKIIVSR